MKKYLAVFAALFVAALTACSSNPDKGASETAPTHNASDVMFAQMMIPHHQQAIEMADMVAERQVSPALGTLAKQIKDAQQPEIDTLTSWLEDWDEASPTAATGHDGHGGMSGMMTPEDMNALASADGPAFETMWLEMMIEHHQGAVEMAQEEKSAGQFADAVSMAEDIISGQQAEINQMKKLLGE